MSKQSRRDSPRAIVRQALRSLTIPKDHACMVLVKSHTSLSKHDVIASLAKTMSRAGMPGLVVVVDSFDDLTVLDSEKLLEYGWIYIGKPTDELAKDTLPEDVNDKEAVSDAG